MVVSRVTRVSNPRRRVKRRNPRKMSLKQKLMFGTKRQRAAARASLSRKRANPKRKRTVATRRRVVRRRAAANPVRRRRRRSSNPAYMLTLGGINPRPRRRRKTAANPKRRTVKRMAKTRTRRRTRRASANPRRRRKNSVRVIVRRRNRRRRAVASNPRRRRRSNPRRRMTARRVHHRSRRRNPQLFGHSVGAFEMAKAIAGGLAGVAITKAVPNMLPAGFANSSPTMNAVTSVVVAVGAGMLTKMLVKGDPALADAVLFGGLMQAGSVILNAFLPQVGTYIGLQGLGNGMGDIIPGRFPVPQNPIMAAVPGSFNGPMLPAPMPAAGMHGAGVGAIYNPYGRAF